jgi:hypothetical protein
MGMDLIEARYKLVYMQLAVEKDWVSIYFVSSHNQGQGEVQEMIDLLKKDCPNKRLMGSYPLTDTMKHIFDKKGVDYGEE